MDIIKHGGYKASSTAGVQETRHPTVRRHGRRLLYRARPRNTAASRPFPLRATLPHPHPIHQLTTPPPPLRLPLCQISALHIESVLLEHPLLSEVAVLGLPDEVYGEVRPSAGSYATRTRQRTTAPHVCVEACVCVCAFLPLLCAHLRAAAAVGATPASPGLPPPTRLQRIAAVVALKNGGDLTLQQLRAFASASLPAYQLPAELVVVPAIPRNAMGKVNKKELRQQLFSSG